MYPRIIFTPFIMKKKLIPILLLSVIGCVNSEVTLNNCEAPTLDGALHAFSSNCVKDTNEHIRLEGVNIPSGQSLNLFALASGANQENGIKISFSGGADGSIEIKHPSASPNTILNRNLTNEGTWCIDIHHKYEHPDHVLVWSGDNCKAGAASGSNAIFDSNGEGWLSSGDPTGKHFNYKASSSAVKVSKISAGKAIIEDEE